MGLVAPEATDANETPSSGAARARAPRGWPFVPLAPLVVLVVGAAVALGIGLVGLDRLTRAGGENAAERADVLARTVAARLSDLAPDKRLSATELVARRTAAEYLVVADETPPRIVHDVTLGVPDLRSLERMLRSERGVVGVRFGRARFAVHPIAGSDSLRLIAIVAEPTYAVGAPALIRSLAALVTLLLVVAGGVAFVVSRNVAREIEFVTYRVRGMSQVRSEPTGELIPPRTMDQVGLLTSAFNKLVGRFAKAEKEYRADLVRAGAADRERAAFLAAVSHELRSPLNAILGFADILMEEVDGPLSPSAREEVEQIRGSGAHLLALINDILELSALESGQLRLSRERVDLSALATEVVREARGLVGRKPLSVFLENPETVIARVDSRRVRQILGNLVNNAIKFTQAGSVVVRVVQQRNVAILSVADSGPGISAAERAVIFKEFKQTPGERQHRRGTGLGLAIARRLVLLHQGSIDVQSEVGRGSMFTVILPIGNVDAPPSRRPPPRDHEGNLITRSMPKVVDPQAKPPGSAG